jgi:hypothetical protein
MNRQMHGILSLVLIAAAALVALSAIVQSSVFFAVLYLVGILLSALVIMFSFCTKCPCRTTGCGHVLPGILMRYFPPRPEGPYTLADKLGVVVPLVFLIVFPQYWLLANTGYFVIFAVLCLIAAAEIQFCVCRGCTNCNCPFHQA